MTQNNEYTDLQLSQDAKQPQTEEKLIPLTNFFEMWEREWNEAVAEMTVGVHDIPIDQIRCINSLLYRVDDGEDMRMLVESIKEFGVITPVIVRISAVNRYEMISGYRRLYACKALGLTTIPCKVVTCSLKKALMLMPDSNIQRSRIAPCEKGRAFKMKMKMKALIRKDEAAGLDYRLEKSIDEILLDEIDGEVSGESDEAVQKYIRLTYLIDELQTFTDRNMIKVPAAVELSYLSEEAQRHVLDLIEETDSFPSYEQAVRMRKAFNAGRLGYELGYAIMNENKPGWDAAVKIRYDDIQMYFEPYATSADVIKDILKGLELLQKQRNEEGKEVNQ